MGSYTASNNALHQKRGLATLNERMTRFFVHRSAYGWTVNIVLFIDTPVHEYMMVGMCM